MTRLEIISDPICPWCYIGKSKLEKALASAGNPFDITWRPFQLNPDMPPEGMDRLTYLESKFGTDRATDVYAQIEKAATDAGLEVDFSRMKRTPNTVDAHRVIRWAKTSDHQGDLVSALFERYFKLGEDISDHAVLAGAARQAGMDGDVVARLLQGNADREEVLREDREAREMGVSGVPTFLIGGTYVVQGAQDSVTWEKIIADLTAAAAQMGE